jgi:hypothetical protein
MSSPFTTLSNGVTKEQIDAMARSGQVPSNLKSEVSKMYIVIFTHIDGTMYSEMSAAEEVDGEFIVCEGREATYDRIINFLNSDLEPCSVDINKSKVLVEGVDAGKSVSLLRFIGFCKNFYPNKEIDLSRHLEAIGVESDETAQVTRQATGFGGNSGTMLNE